MVCLPDTYRCWRRLKSYLKIKTMVEAVHQMQVFHIFQRNCIAQVCKLARRVGDQICTSRSSTPSNSLIPVPTQRQKRVIENFRSLFSPYGPSARSSWLRPPPGKNPRKAHSKSKKRGHTNFSV